MSQQELAVAAGVSRSTIKYFEGGNHVPFANNLSAIERALMRRGVSFQDKGITVADEISLPSESADVTS